MWRAMRMAGLTGGILGMKGTLFGEPYAAGSWQDNLIEAFGGTHDVIGGQVSGSWTIGDRPRFLDTITAAHH